MRGCLALALTLLLAAAGAQGQESTQAHMEGCLIWDRSGPVAVRNECGRPLALLFMTVEDQQVSAADLAPGGRFTADVAWGQSGGFIFTACPIGYRPSVRFGLENKEAIALSLYYCVSGRPTS